MGLITIQLARELFYTITLLVWVIIVVYPITRYTYNLMIKHGASHIKAVYYNRKIIHILAGGVVSILIPLLRYETPYTIIPMIIILAVAVYLPHKKGRLLYWFQDPDNINEVHFIIMWGVVMVLSWIIFRDWIYGVIPVSFMSFGDGVTGIIRNLLYNKRNKSWYGNLAMLVVTAPVGYILAGIAGLIAAIVASIVEHFEVSKRIDDNITIPLASFFTLIIFIHLGI